MPTSLEEVLALRQRPVPAADELSVTGSDPVFSTRFKIGETCASVLAGVGTALNDLWEMRTGRRQSVAIDVRRAAATLRSTHYLQQPDAAGAFQPVRNPRHEAMIRVTQPWPTKDGRWFLPHFGLPNLQERVQNVLQCDLTPESVGAAVANWNALDLEDAIDKARACGAMVRSNAEWLGDPHGQVLQAKPIVEVIKIADGDPEPMPEFSTLSDTQPLTGLRVLDLTRILAGPIAARTLAENGADVLMVAAEHVPQIREHVMDTGHGKRSCFLDLKTPEGINRIKELARTADVFSQGYRPGIMAKLGLAPEDLAKIRPGIVCLSISCFGADGPFSHRAGWEQVAQTVTGICNEGSPTRPALLPAAACDYTTGYLGAYGVLIALARRAREGGSYHVRVSLCQSGMFIYRQGKTEPDEQVMDLSAAELDQLRIESDTTYGPLHHLGPVLQLSETPPRWLRPTPGLGTSAPEWLPRKARVEAAQ